MAKKSNMFNYSLATTILMIIWTVLLPTWNSQEWFVNKWIHNMWVGFDIILSILLITLTYGLYKKKEFVKYLSPTIFGMIIIDWIFNFQLWLYGGYNLLETRFLISYVFIAISLVYFFWFTSKIYKEYV